MVSGTSPELTNDEQIRQSAQKAARERGTPRLAQLIIDCPNCATPIEAVTTHLPNTDPNLTAEGDRTCLGCGKRWRISYTITWEEQPAQAGPPG